MREMDVVRSERSTLKPQSMLDGRMSTSDNVERCSVDREGCMSAVRRGAPTETPHRSSTTGLTRSSSVASSANPSDTSSSLST